MPGRQAHGRSLMGGTGTGTGKRKSQRSKARSNKKALDAYSIADREIGDQLKSTPRTRELDADLGGVKHGRDADSDEDETGDEGPPRKRAARHSDVEHGEDSSGNEWQFGAGSEDSDIDSDEAFGPSDDDDDFGGKKVDDEDEGDEADGASLGSDAIDLAAALDAFSSEDEAQQEAADDGDSESSEESIESEDDEDDDDDISETGVNNWVNKFSGVPEEEPVPTKSKIGLKDLGLLGVKDPQLRKSLKLLAKEEKSSKPQKLAVPLARRHQAQLDRSAAYEQTNKTLERWNETVKQNRRADHLMFPLAQTETGLARHDNSEIAPLDSKTHGSELERAIHGIMEESGLGPGAEKEVEDQGDVKTLSKIELQDLWQAKRRDRELKSREDAKAKRLKKIKSKAYHRVHRKERERNDIKEHEARVAAGEVDSEGERDAVDRQRATERMGARHRESKWAKMSNKAGRAAWDDDVRLGISEMARRDAELRRRVEGKTNADDDEDASDFSGLSDGVDDRKRLLRELRDVSDAEDEASGSKLMNMSFMKKMEARKKAANDDMVAQIRRDLASDDEEFDGSESEAEDVGRKSFGLPGAKKTPALSKKARKEKAREEEQNSVAESAPTTNAGPISASSAFSREPLNGTGGAWSTGAASKPSRKQKGKKVDSSANVLDIDSSAVVIKAPAPAPRSKPAKRQAADTLNDDSPDREHFPLQFNEQDLLDRAFGGMDVVADFEQEKRDIEADEDEKEIDNTLPGWGSWIGSGVSSREQKRHKGRFITKVEGVKPSARQDAKKKNVIINERRNKKNSKYLASQLPYPYESSLQYEGTLRLPIGPEWVTKDTFQNATKPKVIIKQGIIAPMAKPMH
ncbi:small-subunit processome [Xylariales sp. AK1849]|nr:small-subunit processome [Xylariales sp. AK1849]